MGLVLGAAIVAVRSYRALKVSRAIPTYDRVFLRENAALGPPSGTRVVFFGDSRIAQWAPLPDLPGSEIVLRGVGGETTEQMRSRLASDVVALEPEWVVLQAGINDLVAASLAGSQEGSIAARTRDNLTGFVGALHEQGIGVVLLSVIPPARRDPLRFLLWPGSLEDHVVETNRALKRLPGDADLRFIDTRAVLQDDTGAFWPGVNADTLHLTREGYARLNRAIESALEAPRDALQ